MRLNDVYVIVWRWADGHEMRQRRFTWSRKQAERWLRKEKKKRPGQDIRVELAHLA